jgi:NitT/TauT family transport system substrate-binding protein
MWIADEQAESAKWRCADGSCRGGFKTRPYRLRDRDVLPVWSLRHAILFAVICLSLLALAGLARSQEPEQRAVRLAVGGKPALFYLPLTVTEQLGYFSGLGLNVEISDFPGGARALQALIGGSADVVAGAYDHTIQMQAKNQAVVAVVLLGQFPGYVLAVLDSKAARYHSPADLKGMKIGVTAPGSSTHFMVQHLMVKSGLQRDDASFIGVGASASAVAAVRRGAIDALVNVDPVISLLESENLIKVVADTRSREGTQDVYGGPYPAAVLYAMRDFVDRNPRTIQALVNAFVRGLTWTATHPAAEIAELMPEEYALGNKALYVASIAKSLPMYSRDGRFDPAAGETAYAVLRAFDPAVAGANIDVAVTYTNKFVDKTR